MKAKTLPSFKKIEYCKAKYLHIIKKEFIREGSVVEAYGPFMEIPVAGSIGADYKTDLVSGETVYTTKITLLMKDYEEFSRHLIHELTMNDCCFRLTDVYNKSYILGLNEKPHPSIKPAFQSSEVSAGQRAFAIEIQYVNLFSFLKLV